ncbi:MAG: major capsid protein [Deltaproteobacteria bacterium]|nr:major capsid protein [Deltaproteobacteria bacterium]
MLNPFEANDAFNMVSLTTAINILPNNYGRLRELNLMPAKGVRSRSVIVEEKNGVLNLLPTLPPGSPGTQNKMGKRKVRTFTIPHIPVDDVIMPDEYEGLRAFGSESDLETLSSIMNDHLQTGRNKFAITLEHLRMGALKGIILDADASTLYNLYTEFGIAQKTVDFDLDNDAIDVPAKCREVVRHIEDNLLGEVMSSVKALVSREFFDDLIAHDSVKELYLGHVAAVNVLGGDPRKDFKIGNISFEEYAGVATDPEGTPRRFIAEGEGHAFPLGTMNAFETLFAPADFLETVNTIGKELYAKQEMRKFNRGVDLHMQSNPLPICYRPGILVKMTA